MLRLLLLKFLPRRLLPFLFLLELIQLVRRWQTRDDRPPPRNVTPRDATPREVTSGGAKSRNG
jgi:hypothetical protein